MVVGGQAGIFLLAVGIGAVAGLLYDAYRVLRLRTKARGLWGDLGDLLFWSVAFGVVFTLLLRANHVDLRLYVLGGIMGGVLLYFSLLGRAAFRLLDFLWHLTGKLEDFLFILLEILGRALLFPVHRSLILIWWPVKVSCSGSRYLGKTSMGGMKRQAGVFLSLLRSKAQAWRHLLDSNKRD